MCECSKSSRIESVESKIASLAQEITSLDARHQVQEHVAGACFSDLKEMQLKQAEMSQKMVELQRQVIAQQQAILRLNHSKHGLEREIVERTKTRMTEAIAELFAQLEGER